VNLPIILQEAHNISAGSDQRNPIPIAPLPVVKFKEILESDLQAARKGYFRGDLGSALQANSFRRQLENHLHRIKKLGLSVMINEKWYYFGLGRITDCVEPVREARHKWCRQDKQDYLERNSKTHARKRNRVSQASCNVKQP
jgi:hypothetical protein